MEEECVLGTCLISGGFLRDGSVDLGFAFVKLMFRKLFACRPPLAPGGGSPGARRWLEPTLGGRRLPQTAPARVPRPFPARYLQHRLRCAQDPLMPAWPPLHVPWPPKCTLSPPSNSHPGTLRPYCQPHSQDWVCRCAHGRARLLGGMQVCSEECMHIPESLGPMLGAWLSR